ncbi:hypothetical protein [Methanothermococcus okinawensis]|uniref:Uncharacterized protein n=1 Tax=Methanothermococcus okinawensis (strain DSM 14208 / JCM 11175 / IH1) TaxID=647113 RepID=F8ANM4_METOI|nr:hypothetical protein [Methanothermococcus okinawensis]AEH07084.1 hypothetical protein Metok_1115 [Methanothermococcus okinawensis IH1]
MSEVKIVRTGYYDKYGKKSEEDEFTYITFNIGKEGKPNSGDLFVQITNIKGVPILVAKYVADEFGGSFERPDDIITLDELKKYGLSEDIISELKEICISKGINWV